VRVVQDRGFARIESTGGNAGQGIRRRLGLRLLFSVSKVYARMWCGGSILPGAFDPRREVSVGTSGGGNTGVWRKTAVGTAAAFSPRPSARGTERTGVPDAIGTGARTHPMRGDDGCSGGQGSAKHGAALQTARRGVFSVHHDAGNGTDQQPRRTSDSIRGH